MDGVIADFHAGVNALCDEFLDTTEINSSRDRVNALCEANPEIFHDLPLIDGAIPAVHHLMNVFEVYFLSTPMWNVPASFTGKAIWLDKHFGSVAHRRLILTARKDLNIGDYLIDDRLFNGVDKFKGEHIHFGQPKFKDWDMVLEYLFKTNNFGW